MSHVGSSAFIVYFDNVRVDQYVLAFNSQNSLAANGTGASITMLRSDSIDEWKAYLTQVRIFVQDKFTKKYVQVFVGDIVASSYEETRFNMGTITFQIKGLYHWLDIPVPIFISSMSTLNAIQKFVYQAQNIDVDKVQEFMQTQQESGQTTSNIKEIVSSLFQKLSQGYLDLGSGETSYDFVDMQTRFKIMADINPEFRDAGFLDVFTFVKASNIQTFYVYLEQILTQMMFEFYQDRDGSMRIKTPSWNDNIPKNHIVDEHFVTGINRSKSWEVQPTRILTIGGNTEISRAVDSGSPLDGTLLNAQIPVGLFIFGTNLSNGRYIKFSFQQYLKDTGSGITPDDGTGTGETLAEGAVSAQEWTKKYPKTAPFGHYYNSTTYHGGIDFGSPVGTPLPAFYGGKVITSKDLGGADYGQYIVIEDSRGFLHYYGHLSKRYVKAGQTIKAGLYIGLTGNTGNSTGPHLHYEVRDPKKNSYKQALDPQPFIDAAPQFVSSGTTANVKGMPTVANYKGPDNTGYQSGRKAAMQGTDKWNEALAKGCAKYGMDPVMAKVLMAIETGGNIALTNALGTRGLFQIIPSRVDVKVDGAKLQKDGEYNVEALCKVMKTKMAIIKSKGHPLTVEWAARSWIGFGSSGAAYQEAFVKMYEGFGSKYNRTNPIMGNPTKSGTKGSGGIVGPDGKTVLDSGGSDSSDANKKKGKPTPYPSKGANYILSSSQKKFSKLITANAGKLPPDLIWAVIKKFSNFNPNMVKSDSIGGQKRYGLMGVPESVARQKYGDDFSKKIYNPTNNISLGSTYLAETIREMKKVTYGLAAYFIGIRAGGFNPAGSGVQQLDAIIKRYKKSDYVATSNYVEGRSHKSFGVNDEYGPYWIYDDMEKNKDKQYVKQRPPLNRSGVAFVADVCVLYAGLKGGNYIKGDPHRGFAEEGYNYGAPTKQNKRHVCIDAGHGDQDSGAVANGLTEKTLNLEVANRLKKKLEENPAIDVIMTRETDVFIDLEKRPKKGLDKGAGYFVSIHFNAGGGSGIETFIQPGASVGSGSFRDKIHKRMAETAKEFGIGDRGKQSADLSVLRNSKTMSACLLELGFLDNEKDATVIKNQPEYLDKMIDAIALGIVEGVGADGSNFTPSAPAENVEDLPDLFSVYDPVLSSSEKKYKMVFRMLEQDLIRVEANGGNFQVAEEYLEKYSRYMMYVLRSQAYSASVSLSIPMPSLTVGWNSWLEPNRKNLVGYVTSVNHQGSAESNTVLTSYTMANIRRPEKFTIDDVENLFIGSMDATADNLFKTISQKDLPTVRKKLKSLPRVGSAEMGSNEYLKELYTINSNPDDSIVQGSWHKEMTATQIKEQIDTLYKKAPKLVIERAESVKQAMKGAISDFENFLQ